jgi:hypothetical protein
VKNIIDYVMNREWISAFIGLETVAGAVLEWTDVMPDGQAKGWIVAAAGLVTAYALRLRVYAQGTVDDMNSGTVPTPQEESSTV